MQPKNPLSDWVARWNTPLQRFLGRRLARSVDAEDLAQEVYLRLLRVEDLGAIAEPQAYLYRVARNLASEWRARARERHPHVQEELDELVELTTPETLLGEMADERALSGALRPLPAVIRAVIYLKLRDGKTHEEIAAHLGVSTRMVRKYLTEGYASLRASLVKERSA
jgi:RNA polymerase sigma factor (sigma-70 family)